MADIVIDVVSDVVCPWCFEGQRRLGRALASLPNIDAVVRWRPFQLDPTIPPGGVDHRRRMEQKFGSAERVAAAEARLTELGAAEGIRFRFDRIDRSPNTLDAHRLIRWAGEHGPAVQNALAAELFSRYFEQGEDVGHPDVLARAAAAAGMPEKGWCDRLAGDIDRDAVRHEAADFSRVGVSGVPCFILGGRYAVSGAQEAAVLAQAIEQMAGMVAQ